MKTNGTIESVGVLLKEETLQTVEHYVLENTMVLESIEPFPGYHGENMPTGTKPDSLFLITDKFYPVETIFRVSQHLCCYQNIPIDATPVEIFILNSTLNGVRIRGLSNYSLIAEIQGCYMDKNVRFMKRKSFNAPGLMRITKIFMIEKLDDHIFRDLEDENTYYLAVPYHFNWNLFRKVTLNIKNNLDNSNFDCASGFIYLKDMMEFVRVYVHNPEIGRLKIIREKYLEEIVKIRDDAM
jgi:hypothetical protein